MRKVLQEVVLNENELGTRLTLAIPFAHLMTYYETKLLRQVISTEFSLVFTLAIPFSSQSTILQVYHAIQIPMPDSHSSKASVWDIETEYIGVTLNGHEAALLSNHDLAQCIGLSAFSICYSGFAMEKSKDSCLSTLFFKDSIEALQACTVRPVLLPLREKAKNVGKGRWLITSASPDFLLTKTDMDSSSTTRKVVRKQGCRVCLVTLPCGSELEGPNVHLRSDLATCASQEPKRVNITLPAPLATLFSKLPPIAVMSHILDEDTAKFRLLEKVQIQLAQIPDYKRRDLTEVEKIAKPIISEKTRFNPQFSSKFNDTVQWSTYLIFAIVSFCVSMGAHILFSYIMHKYQQVHRRFPFRLTLPGRQIKNKPVAVIPKDDWEYLQHNLDHPILKKAHLICAREDVTFKNPTAISMPNLPANTAT